MLGSKCKGGNNNSSSSNNKRSHAQVQNADADDCLVGKAPQANVALRGQHVAFHSVTADDDLVDILDDNNVSIESDEHKGLNDLYAWLADSGTMSHITHQQDAFATYETLPKLTVSGIGGITASAVGKGTVFLHSDCDGVIHTCCKSAF